MPHGCDHTVGHLRVAGELTWGSREQPKTGIDDSPGAPLHGDGADRHCRVAGIYNVAMAGPATLRPKFPTDARGALTNSVRGCPRDAEPAPPET